MKNIQIFVAGSKDLVKERDCLKVVVSDLNSLKKRRDCVFTLHSYEFFNDDQDEYNRFIENEADIVIFILDGRIGEKTEEEFLKATDSYNKNRRPKIMVFLKNAASQTEDIGRIKGLIAGRLGGSKYYVDYSTPEELKSKAKERILRYADKVLAENAAGDNTAAADAITATTAVPALSDKRVIAEIIASELNKKSDLQSPSISQTPTKAGRRQPPFKAIIAVLSGIIIVLAGLLCWRMFRTERILIFAGGGSVKNYINDSRGVDIFDYPNSVYCHLASGTAWALLIEEANRSQENKSELERFTSVCLSADDIDSTSFINEKTRGIFKKSRIVRYNIGSDTLAVYIHTDIVKKIKYLSGTETIPVDSLRSLVKYALSMPQDIRIFTTSKTSGTLRLFQSCFEPSDSINLNNLLDNEQTFLFYKDSEATYINSLDIPNQIKPYIILCSRHYFPETLESASNRQFTKLYVYRGEKAVIKPMNLYFLAFYDNEERDCFRIRKQVFKFLEAIKAEDNIDPDVWADLKRGKVKAETGDLILNLN